MTSQSSNPYNSTSSGPCPSCGSYFLGSHACNVVDYGQWQRQIQQPRQQWIPSTTTASAWPTATCRGHCFCIEMTPPRSKMLHMECCKCSDRKLK